MGMPEIAVEVAFDSGVLTPAADRTWTDISDYVELDQFITIARGRADEFQTTSPSTLSLTLDNSDGRFTPARAASPYYPDVKIGRPIRVTVDPDGDASVRFTGYVDEWPVDWQSGVESTARATLTATSRLARLGEGAELRSVVETEIMADNPVAYYPLGEPEGVRVGHDLAGSDHIGMQAYGAGASYGTGQGVSTDELPAAQIEPHLDAEQPNQLVASFLANPLTECTVEIVVVMPPRNENDVVAAVSLYQSEAVGANYKVLQLRGASIDVPGGTSTTFDAAYTERVNGVSSLLGLSTTYADPATALATMDGLFDGERHHLLLTFEPGVSPELKTYFDGALFNTKTGTSGTLSTTMPTWTHLVVGPLKVDSGNAAMTVCQVAVYDSILSDDRIEAHALAALDGFSSELAGERIERIAGYAGLDLTEVDTDPGVSPISHIDTTDNTVDALLRTIEETEGGVLYDERDGTLRFRDRDHRYQTAAAFTLDASSQQLEAEGFRPILDRTAITNGVSARSLDGTLEQRYADSTSADDYGHRRRDLELATTSSDQLFQAAAWRVNRYKDPRPRFPALAPVDALTLPTALGEQIRDADISTRFAVSNLPDQSPDDATEFFIEGITETLGLESWRFQFNASPAEIYDGLFVLNTSELNSTDVLAY